MAKVIKVDVQWTIPQLTKILNSTTLDKKEHHKISNIPKFRCKML